MRNSYLAAYLNKGTIEGESCVLPGSQAVAFRFLVALRTFDAADSRRHLLRAPADRFP